MRSPSVSSVVYCMIDHSHCRVQHVHHTLVFRLIYSLVLVSVVFWTVVFCFMLIPHDCLMTSIFFVLTYANYCINLVLLSHRRHTWRVSVVCHFNTFLKIFRLTPVSVRNKAGLNVCLPFHASTKSFSELNKIWYGYTVCCMTRFKVRVTEVPKLWKWLISKSISSAGMHVINRLMVNYTPIQLSKFYPYRCSSLFGSRDLHTKDVSPLAILWGVDWQSHMGANFCSHLCLTAESHCLSASNMSN